VVEIGYFRRQFVAGIPDLTAFAELLIAQAMRLSDRPFAFATPVICYDFPAHARRGT